MSQGLHLYIMDIPLVPPHVVVKGVKTNDYACSIPSWAWLLSVLYCMRCFMMGVYTQRKVLLLGVIVWTLEHTHTNYDACRVSG